MSKRLLKGSTTSDPNKLTQAQQNLLRELAFMPRYVASYYKPGSLLVSKGLAKLTRGEQMHITEKGLRWLQESEAGK